MNINAIVVKLKTEMSFAKYRTQLTYSELDSSGSVKKLTYGVSLKRKSGETELYILFNKLFLFTLILFMKYFSL